MKLFKSLFAIALVVGLGCGVLAGCFGNPTIAKDLVDFKYYVGNAAGTAVADTDITGEDGKYTVVVAEDATNFEINLKKFFAENDKVLGEENAENKFSFTRTGDTPGTGYAYKIVEDKGVAAENTYKKFGSADAAKITTELPADSRRIYIDTAGNIVTYINMPTDGYTVDGTTAKFVLNGDDGSTYEFEVTVKIAAPVEA